METRYSHVYTVILTHHDGGKAEYLAIVLQHLDKVLLGWLRNERKTRLLAILQRSKPIVGGQLLRGWENKLRLYSIVRPKLHVHNNACYIHQHDKADLRKGAVA